MKSFTNSFTKSCAKFDGNLIFKNPDFGTKFLYKMYVAYNLLRIQLKLYEIKNPKISKNKFPKFKNKSARFSYKMAQILRKLRIFIFQNSAKF
jgi:hypothetical protein